MKTKKVKKLLSDLYYRGIYDGMDIHRIPQDRFMGNQEARNLWEENQLTKAYNDLKKLL